MSFPEVSNNSESDWVKGTTDKLTLSNETLIQISKGKLVQHFKYISLIKLNVIFKCKNVFIVLQYFCGSEQILMGPIVRKDSYCIIP